MTMNDLHQLGASQAAQGIRQGLFSSRELVEALLERIERINPDINALVTVDDAAVLEQVHQADNEAARGVWRGPLHGVPFTVKDCFETAGLRSTAGTPALRNHRPESHATVVENLCRQGAILLGKSNTPALAMDTQCDSPLFGVTRNPWDRSKTPGGSSGGEAAAVAAMLSPIGIGSDIGGSLRLPAHFCGLFAMKPSYGLVSKAGHIPPLPDTVSWVRYLMSPGPIARCVTDLRLALQAMMGSDGLDTEVCPVPWVNPAPKALQTYRIAWMDGLDNPPVCSATRQALQSLMGKLDHLGCHVERLSIPEEDFQGMWETYGNLVGSLMSAHLPLPIRLLLRLFAFNPFQNDPLGRAAFRKVLATAKDLVFILDQRDRWIRRQAQRMEPYDVLALPVSSTTAAPCRKRGKINHPIVVEGRSTPGHLASLGYTCPFNLLGVPVVVLPIGLSEEGLPIGIQLVGKAWQDMELLHVAEAIAERFFPYHPPPEM